MLVMGRFSSFALVVLGLCQSSVDCDSTFRRVWHLTDVHVDPLYVVGSDWKTEYCDAGKGDAGLFGHSEGNCATPKSLYEGALDFMRKQAPANTVLFTGDFTMAGLKSQDQVGSVIDYDIAKLRQALPTAKVFACVGNHDTYPGDVYPYPFPALYPKFAQWWGHDLDATAREQLNETGYYSTAAGDGLRVIALNSMYLGELNPLMRIKTGPEYHAGVVQMAWFARELAAAAARKERVWILAHVPFSDASLPEFQMDYQNLVAQYKDTVTGQFFGHDHNDYFRLTRACEGSSCAGEPTGVVFVGPSLTEGYPPENPGLRLYTTDEEHRVVDHVTYRVDLERANRLKQLDFELEYSAKTAFGLPDLSARSFAQLVDRLNTTDLFDEFYKYYYRGYTGPSLPKCDDSKCKQAMLCRLKYTLPVDVERCSGQSSSFTNIYCHPQGGLLVDSERANTCSPALVSKEIVYT